MMAAGDLGAVGAPTVDQAHAELMTDGNPHGNAAHRLMSERLRVGLAEQGRQHLSGPVGQGLAIHDSVELSRLVLGMAATRGADGRVLARDAGLPTWLLGVDQAMIASSHHTRLWELAEPALQDPCLGLAVVHHHRVGDLDLYDYLFTTAATVREAQDVTGSFSTWFPPTARCAQRQMQVLMSLTPTAMPCRAAGAKNCGHSSLSPGSAPASLQRPDGGSSRWE
jgi:hypothetical protein